MDASTSQLLLPGYYHQYGKVYEKVCATGSSEDDIRKAEKQQDAVRLAAATVWAIGNNNGYAEPAIFTKEASSNMHASIAAMHEITSDPYLWLVGGFLIGRHAGGGGFCGGSDCKEFSLGLAIVALVITCIASAYLTVRQAIGAHKVRQQANEIKRARLDIQDENIQNICKKIERELNKEWVSQSLKSTFTAVCTAGTGLLTVSAIFAIYAVLASSPMSPYATLFAIAGGGAVGVGVAAHAIRYLTLKARKKSNLIALEALFQDSKLLPTPLHPYTILSGLSDQTVSLAVPNQRRMMVYYTKNRNSFSRSEGTCPQVSGTIYQLDRQTGHT